MATKRRLTKKEASKILKSVDQQWKAFWFNHGIIAHNLNDLLGALKKISPANFGYHVAKQKNDIADWVQEVIGDTALAEKLRKSKTLATTKKAVETRLKELDKVVQATEKKVKKVVRKKK